MKTISKILGLVLFSALTFTSCSDDDNGGGNNGGDPVDTSDLVGGTTNGGNSTFTATRNNLLGEINDGEVILDEGTYKLTGRLVVNDGATLTIKEGVTIEATSVTGGGFGAARYIAVAQGGKINVEGTSSAPVVMTATSKTTGAWGGLVLCGKAPINIGTSASAEVSDLTYGGNDVNDNSGSIKYLRIEYSGFSYNSEKEFNGLSMFGVGKGTTIEYVQVHEGSDDGFEWFGGTVDARYLIVSNFEVVPDDLFDWTEGWNGTGEYWYGVTSVAGNRGIEADNNSSNHDATPTSDPTISYLTLVGNEQLESDQNENQAFKLRVGTKGIFDNVVLKNWTRGFDIQHDAGITHVASGALRATNVKFENVTTKSKGTNTAGDDIDVSAFYSESESATGAGNGANVPTWAQGWTIGL